ncbi:hypothetical protein NUU61_004955 [Penicillium alfredii]|uniref:Mediator of RNA polymerase II transcription subunit 9 n=1 Tax=Penicillium alfredii TaxID=1506179 RepID=A0A9W9F8U9_9EURO|nr:uncharacterized protein NUU61_004955 [Penicillium alfredii]KAJ5095599.1 hypothetical protein NUU61_004955 [Penicillium alfredii]
MASRSPAAVTPFKSSAAPESPSKDATTASSQTVPFPPPQTFEIIPPLHGILVRLLSQKRTSDGAGGPPGVTGAPDTSGAPAQSQTQQPSTAVPGGENNGNAPSSQAVPEVAVLDSTAHPPLDVKDLPTETSSVKIRISKARTVVEGLPDVHRSVAEQQKEIDGLEDRVARLHSVISDFGARAGMNHEDSTKMVEY